MEERGEKVDENSWKGHVVQERNEFEDKEDIDKEEELLLEKIKLMNLKEVSEKNRRSEKKTDENEIKTAPKIKKYEKKSDSEEESETESSSSEEDPLSPPTVSGELDVMVPGDLYVWSEKIFEFEIVMQNIEMQIRKAKKKEIEYSFYILNDGNLLQCSVITEALAAKFYFGKETESIIYVLKDQGVGMMLWSVIFKDKDRADIFRKSFIKALWENKTQKVFPQEEEQRNWIFSAWLAPKEKTNDEEESDDDRSFSDDDGGSDEEQGEFREKVQTKNSVLTVGRKSDRSFVIRGSKIGVFKRGQKGVKYQTTLDDVMSPSKKKIFEPHVAMLHEEDTSLLLLNKQDKGSIYRMDIERGKVVEEYNTEGMPALNLLPENKYAQACPLKTFLALNHGGIFAIDPRDPKCKVVKNRTFQYSNVKAAMIQCGATTKEGHIVVGTKSGEIRLFGANTLMARKSDSYLDYTPRAKNTLPGLGDPITAIDVTSDGLWILVTCADYLLIIPTKSPIENCTGFDKALGRNKPAPVRLVLNERDRERVGKKSFTPAKFNYGIETSICTSVGSYVISWNFAKVRRGILDAYIMREYHQTVVADDFSFDTDKNIIVAMPDDVRLAKNKK